MSDRREEIAKQYVPCRCDKIYTSRGLTAPDCPFHSTDPEMAMDEYWTERAMELLDYMAKNQVTCYLNREKEPVFYVPRKGFDAEYLSKEKLFENFL